MIRKIVLVGILAVLGVLLMAAGPPEEDPSQWSIGGGDDGGTAKYHLNTPVCVGSSYVSQQLDQIAGRSEMTCSNSGSAIVTLQGMYAEIRKCNSWAGLWCLSSSSYEYLDSDSQAGPGEWTLPDSDTYLSSALPEGWFRVRTRHTVTWTGGSDVGYSRSVWIHIN